MYPDWTNDFNKAQGSSEDPETGESSFNRYDIVDAYEAIVYAHNNVIDANCVQPFSHKNRSYGDADDPNWGYWYVADTTGNYVPEDLGLKFSDMLYPENGDFQLLKSSPAYTAGVEGAPVGDPRWYVDKMAAKVNFSATLENTSVGELTITPIRQQYYEDDVVVLTVKTHGLTTFKGWSDGNTDNPRIVVLGTEDVNLVGTCQDDPYLVSYQFEGVKGNSYIDTPMAPNYSAVENASLNFVAYIDSVSAYLPQSKMATRVGKITEGSYCLISKTPINLFDSVVSVPNYFMLELPTTGYKGLTFSCDLGVDGYANAKYVAQYSTDSINWTTCGSVEMQLEQWNQLKAELPSVCEEQNRLFIRVIADTTCTDRVMTMGTTAADYDQEFICITNFLVTYTPEGAGIEAISQDGPSINSSAVFDLYGRKASLGNGLRIVNGRVSFIR